MGLFSIGFDSALAARLGRLERKLDMVLEHLGIQLADDEMEEVRRLVDTGQKIEAIKMYRSITGVGLAEAKRAVETGV